MDSPEITIEQIQRVVSVRFGISLQELVGEPGSHSFSYPRHVAMYICRELTDSSLRAIGARFGGRDHDTVHNVTSKIERLIPEDQAVHNLVRELTAQLR